LQGLDDHLAGERAGLRLFAQLSGGHAQAIGQGLGQAGRLLHDRVELFAAQHARLQALDQLGDGRRG
jgi:hypothetical protein